MEPQSPRLNYKILPLKQLQDTKILQQATHFVSENEWPNITLCSYIHFLLYGTFVSESTLQSWFVSLVICTCSATFMCSKKQLQTEAKANL